MPFRRTGERWLSKQTGCLVCGWLSVWRVLCLLGGSQGPKLSYTPHSLRGPGGSSLSFIWNGWVLPTTPVPWSGTISGDVTCKIMLKVTDSVLFCCKTQQGGLQWFLCQGIKGHLKEHLVKSYSMCNLGRVYNFAGGIYFRIKVRAFSLCWWSNELRNVKVSPSLEVFWESLGSCFLALGWMWIFCFAGGVLVSGGSGHCRPVC